MTPRLTVTDDTLWFVFSEHPREGAYAGPFTSEMLAARVNRGEFGESPFIWTQGMDDWQQLSTMHALETFFLEVQSYEKVREAERAEERVAQAMNTMPFAMRDKEFSDIFDPSLPYTAEELALYGATGDTPTFFNSLAEQRAMEEQVAHVEAANQAAEKTWRGYLTRYRLHVVTGFALTLIGVSVLIQTMGASPVLRSEDVTSDEYHELRRAIGESLRFAGPTSAVALSRSKTETPSFYVGANLADGSKLDIAIEGIPETLLGRFHYSMRTTVTIQDGVVKTPALKELNGNPLLAGAYRIQVRPAGDLRVIAQKVYFLGGTQDLNYEAQLKEYQQKLREQAVLEILEVRQLSDTLARQLSETSMKLGSLTGDASLTGVARRARWEKFQESWSQMDSQLTAVMAQWTPAVMDTQMYYSDLYKNLKRAIETVQKVHATQTARLEKGANRPALDQEIASLSLVAQNLIQGLNGQTDKLQKLSTKSVVGKGLPPKVEGTSVEN